MIVFDNYLIKKIFHNKCEICKKNISIKTVRSFEGKRIIICNKCYNITELKCPKCGQVGRWIKEDE